MKIQLVDFDETHYASNMVQSDSTLKWNALGNTYNLIIRGDYGTNITFTEKEKEEIEKISDEQILSGREVRFSENRFFSFSPKGYVNNHPITVAPATYAIFCCEYERTANVCTLFVPNEACLYQCNVVSKIEAHIKAEEVKKRFFSRAPVKQFYSVYIQNIPGYVDGSLHYTFEGCKFKYPITKKMLGEAFSVPAFNGNPPILNADVSNGYQITIR